MHEAILKSQIEFKYLAAIAKTSKCFDIRANRMPVKLFLAHKLNMSETLNRVAGTITGKPPFPNFVKVHFIVRNKAVVEYMQVHGIFRAEFSNPFRSANGIYLLGRWCQILNGVDTYMKCPVLQWAKPPPHLEFIKGSYLQFISIQSVLEQCTVVPKPFINTPNDNFDLNHDDRIMWVHVRGRSALGET